MQMHRHHNTEQGMDQSVKGVGGVLGTMLPTASVLPKAGQEQMKSLLADSIINLCKNSLHFSSEISVEALVGVTLDKQNILLMNINKSIYCDQVTVKKEQPDPPKRRKKGSSPNKRKSSTTAPPNKIAPPPNQSLDLYHRPWDQGALPPNVTIKTEPLDPKDGTLPHSELRAHLESGIGAVGRMPFQQQQAPAGGLFVNGVGGNPINQVNCTQPHNIQLVNGSNGSQGSSSSLNTRSALYQHLQQQQQQRNLQQQQQQTHKNARNTIPPREQNQQLVEQTQQNQTESIQQQQPQQQQFHKQQSVESQLVQPQLRQNRSLSWTQQRSLSVDTSVYSNQSVQSSLSSSPMSSQAATPIPQSSPENLNFCGTQQQQQNQGAATMNSLQNMNRNLTGFGNMKLPVCTESVAATLASPTSKEQNSFQNSSLMQHLQAPATSLIYSSTTQSQVQAQQTAQFSPENHIQSPAEGTPVSTSASFTFCNDGHSSDPRAVSLPTGVNETETQATGLENAPGVMNVEQADESTEKSVLVLDGDDDSDQDDFTSPEKPKRRKSLLNGDVFLGYVHPKPELDRRPNGHLDQVDTSAYINWKAPSGEEVSGQEEQVEIKQELPDWTESYGSDDNNEEEETYDQEEENCGVGGDDSAEDEPCNDLTHQSGNSNFVNEMLEQMEVSPDGEKKCPICSRVLKAKSDMGRHIRTHTKEKPHKCQECGRGFLQSYDLKRHRMQHSGRKPFQCCVCSKGFTRPDYLRNHQQVWHPELYKDC